MPLFDLARKKTLDHIIEQLAKEDYKWLSDSDEFHFDWKAERKNETYKIHLKSEEDILGVMALKDSPEELRIHLNLIEVGATNIGQSKIIEHIVGCLIAFACRIAFEKGYDGFLSLQPKTNLIQLYQNKYGFKLYGRLLAVEYNSSKLLIDKYLPYEEE